MRPASDLADDTLRALDAAAPGVVLAAEDELRAVLLAALRTAQAEALEEAARVTAPNPADRYRMADAERVALDQAAGMLRGAAGRLRSGKAPFPGKGA